MDTPITSLHGYKHIFFIGVAGAGMSALAQFLAGSGFLVSGSDRYFGGEETGTQEKLQAAGISCHRQGDGGISEAVDLVIVSTAIEDSVPEVQQAKALNLPILKRSDLLALIAGMRKTIAVGGTSGKSTVTAMVFHILREAGLQPGIISGAGLVSLIEEGKIGNAETGEGDWLVIEADESDGSIVKYHAETGILLNVDKDHMEMSELINVFTTFKSNTRGAFIVNRSQAASAALSQSPQLDFSSDGTPAGFAAGNFQQKGSEISFAINGVDFRLSSPGFHNMENAAAAVAAAAVAGVPVSASAEALRTYKGIYRRHQILGTKNEVIVIDDYAHNPAKCAASMRACRPLGKKLVAWFQPHGYGPTKFLKDDFVAEISKALRSHDEIWMSEIFYAGGTAVKDISANDLIEELREKGCNAFFCADKHDLLETLRPHLVPGTVLLLMGARDPGLEAFSKNLYENL